MNRNAPHVQKGFFPSASGFISVFGSTWRISSQSAASATGSASTNRTAAVRHWMNPTSSICEQKAYSAA